MSGWLLNGGLWWLVLGLLIGLLVEWLIDWWYWRQRITGYVSEIEQLRSEQLRWRGEADAVRGERDGLRGELTTLRGTYGTLQSEHEELQARFGSVQREHDELQVRFGSVQRERDGLQAQFDTLRAERASLEEKITSLEGKRDGLEGELVGLRERLTSLAGERDGLEGELVGLRGRLTSLTGERDGLEGELVGLRGRLTSLAGERDGLEGELISLRAAHTDLAVQHNDARNNLQRLEGSLSGVRSRLAGFFGAGLGFTAGRAGVGEGGLVEEADFEQQLDLQLTGLRDAQASLNAERDSLTSQLDTLRGVNADVVAERDALRAELDALRAERGGLEAERDRNRDTAQQLEGTLSGFGARLAALFGGGAASRGEAATDASFAVNGGAPADLAQQLELQLNALRDSQARLEAERDSLVNQLDTLRGSFDELSVENSGLDGELATLRNTTTDLSAERDALQAELAALRSQQAELAAERDRNRELALRLDGALNTTRLRLGSLFGSDGTGSAATEATTSAQFVAGGGSELGVTPVALGAIHADADIGQQLDIQLSGLRQSITNLTSERDGLAQQFETLRLANADALAERDRLQAELATLGSPNSSDEVATLEAQIDELREALGVEVAANDRLQSELATLRAARDTQLEDMQLVDESRVGAVVDDGVTQTAADEVTASLRAKINELREALELETTEKDALQVELDELRAQLATRDAPSYTLINNVTQLVRRDQFSSIEGLDAAAEQRLNAAGIYTYADLARLSPEQLHQIVYVEGGPTIDVTYWILQADDFAQGDAANGGDETTQTLDTRNAELASELARLRAENEQLRAVYRDRLVAIDDLDDDAELRLNAAGIYTYADMVQFSPERLREIVSVDGQNEVDTSLWIARARRFLPSQPDRLIDIDGIGPVFERRLHEAGIFTFAELVQQSPERLREIANVDSWHNLDTESWIAQAHQFMASGKAGGS